MPTGAASSNLEFASGEELQVVPVRLAGSLLQYLALQFRAGKALRYRCSHDAVIIQIDVAVVKQ